MSRLVSVVKHYLPLFCALALLFSLSACEQTPTLSFAEIGVTMEVKSMASDLSIASVGSYDLSTDTVNIDALLLNGKSEPVGEGYAYDAADVLPNLDAAIASCTEQSYTAKGILLYHGFGYLAAEHDGVQYLLPISPDTDPGDKMTYPEMLQKASNWQKKHGTVSGGNGLDE